MAALARPPAREVPGIRFVLRPDFDVTPETPDTERAGEIVACDPAVPLGTVLEVLAATDTCQGADLLRLSSRVEAKIF